MGKGLQQWLRPLPMGLLAALLSALVLLPALFAGADWQARRSEQRELQLLRQQSAERIGDFFDSLYASMRQLEALNAARCAEASAFELQQRAAAELFVVGFSRTLPDGRTCGTLRLPSTPTARPMRPSVRPGSTWPRSTRSTPPSRGAGSGSSRRRTAISTAPATATPATRGCGGLGSH